MLGATVTHDSVFLEILGLRKKTSVRPCVTGSTRCFTKIRMQVNMTQTKSPIDFEPDRLNLI